MGTVTGNPRARMDSPAGSCPVTVWGRPGL